MKIISSKSLLLLIISLVILPSCVFARPADPSRFPQYEPLILPAPDTYPNLKNNIQSDSGMGILPESGAQGQGSSADGGIAQPAAGTEAGSAEAVAAESDKKNSFPWTGAVFIAIAVALAAGVVWHSGKDRSGDA